MNCRKLGKSDLLKILLGLEEGKHLEVNGVSYAKARALILEPLEKKGCIMLDGEHIEVGTIKMEVHRGLVKVFKL